MKNQKIIDSIINDTKKILFGFKKLPETLALHSFVFILVVVFIALGIGGIVSYKYVYIAEKAVAVNSNKQLIFDEKKYQSVLLEWQKRDKIFNNITQKAVTDPFSETVAVPSPLSKTITPQKNK